MRVCRAPARACFGNGGSATCYGGPMTTTAEQLKAWSLTNPLWTWRVHTTPKMGRQTAAGALGVTHTAVVAWEKGSNQPTVEHLAAIARLMGVAFDTLEHDWAAWRHANPLA